MNVLHLLLLLLLLLLHLLLLLLPLILRKISLHLPVQIPQASRAAAEHPGCCCQEECCRYV